MFTLKKKHFRFNADSATHVKDSNLKCTAEEMLTHIHTDLKTTSLIKTQHFQPPENLSAASRQYLPSPE